MKLKKNIKIALFISEILIVGLAASVLYVTLIVQKTEIDFFILLYFGIVLSGLFSVVYQLKTIKYYNSKIIKPILLGAAFWIGNILFSILIFCYSLFIIYKILLKYYDLDFEMSTDDFIGLLIIIFILLTSAFIALEASDLYKRVLKTKNQSQTDTIDDIMGCKDDEF
ncbi:hypothetical protein [Thalassobellus sediminis]|uniref:hypothetical protein n=1 Tax=Thalassobellus sediminis TaxID=3367753 RepID=UPI003799BAA6